MNKKRKQKEEKFKETKQTNSGKEERKDSAGKEGGKSSLGTKSTGGPTKEASGKNKFDSEEESDDEDEESIRRKVRKKYHKRTESFQSKKSNKEDDAVMKQFKLVAKKLTKNLNALEDLKEKIGEDPLALAQGAEDLRQLRTAELGNLVITLEAEYESDEDLKEDLRKVKVLMDENNLAFKVVKQELGRARALK